MYIRVKKEEKGQPENVIYEPRQPRNKPITHKLGIYEVPAKFKNLFYRAVRKGKAELIPDDVAIKELAKQEKERLARMKIAAEDKKKKAAGGNKL